MGCQSSSTPTNSDSAPVNSDQKKPAAFGATKIMARPATPLNRKIQPTYASTASVEICGHITAATPSRVTNAPCARNSPECTRTTSLTPCCKSLKVVTEELIASSYSEFG